MNGCVLPGTGIAVDFWNIRACPSAKLFFLSHLHGDHVTGLTSSWRHPIYCSEVTAKLLQEWYHLPASVVHPLESDVSHVIPYSDGLPCRDSSSVSSVLVLQKPGKANDRLVLHSSLRRGADDTDSASSDHGSTGKLNSPQKEWGASLMTSSDSVTVTLINANHCPGSVMFLFEGRFGRILHTGDFRLSEEILQHPALAAVRGKVDRLYLDNTYLHPSCEFPSRKEVAEEIIKLVQEYSDCDIVIGVRNLGKENLLAEIGKALKEDVSITAKGYRVACLQGLPDVFSIDQPNCRIRAVPFRSVSNVQMARWNKVAPTIAILPTALFTGLDGRPFSLQPSVFVMPYSDHSSYSELMKFVGFICPKRVIPIVSSSARGPFGTDISSRADMSCFNHLLEKDGDESLTEESVSLEDGNGAGGEAEKSSYGNGRVKAKLQVVDGRRRKELAALRKRQSLTDARKCSVTKRRERGIEYDETLLVIETCSAENTNLTAALKSKRSCARKTSSENSISIRHVAMISDDQDTPSSPRQMCCEEHSSGGKTCCTVLHTSNGSSSHSYQDSSSRNSVDLRLSEAQNKPSSPRERVAVDVVKVLPPRKSNSDASHASRSLAADGFSAQCGPKGAVGLSHSEFRGVMPSPEGIPFLLARNASTAIPSTPSDSSNRSARNRFPDKRVSGCASSVASQGRAANGTISDGSSGVVDIVREHRGIGEGGPAGRKACTDVEDEDESRAKRRTDLLSWLYTDDDY